MPKINVTTRRDVELSYDSAEKWVIDDEGRLHVIKAQSGGNLASFHRDEWAFVGFAADAKA